MSLLTIDTDALVREEHSLLSLFKERDHDLALVLGFTPKRREVENDWSYAKGTAVVYFVGNKRDGYEAWMTAQKGECGLVAHIHHDTLTRALIDALNRDC